MTNTFDCLTTLTVGGETVHYFSLPALEPAGFPGVARLPYSLKILLENLLRHEDGRFVKADDIEALARWDVKGAGAEGDLVHAGARAAPGLHRRPVRRRSRRDARRHRRGSAAIPNKVNPLQPVELVIDHSVQVDYFGQRERVPAERRARVRAQQGALRVPALGPERVPQLPRRAARHRHRPPGQPRVPRARRRARTESPDGARWRIPTRSSAPTRTRRW